MSALFKLIIVHREQHRTAHARILACSPRFSSNNIQTRSLGEAQHLWGAVRCRRNEVAVFAFTAPLLLLMQMPIVGPLLFLPASAAAAFLADYLHRLPCNAQFEVGGGVPLTAPGRAPPTRPAADIAGCSYNTD